MDISSERKTTKILISDEKAWRFSYLKEQFRIGKLEDLFGRYTEKINHGYFTLFLILQFCISATHFSIVLAINMEEKTLHIVLPDLILYAVAGVIPIIGIFLSESYVKKHPHVLKKATICAFITLYLIDFGLPIYHGVVHMENYRPSYTTHLIIACYIFFTVSSNVWAVLFGLFVTTTHILVLVFITYKSSSVLWKRVGSDLVYYICINGLGIYFRFLNEIVERRGFLDRRACVESNLDLKFVKDQEEQLMNSILPENTIKKVKEEMANNQNKIKKQKPFENKYFEQHQNVTILYADIVNYTEMTTKLNPVTKLVETLNDLFSSFDDASEELKVMRIKFLGDCYYCVAGLPPDPIENHADACVALGLKMIQIIKKVRESRNLKIDMRIGIHTGYIISGIIGISKWQFDIWSKDVLIANKMETEGVAGKVHITKQTRDQLKRSYNIIPTNKGNEDPMLKQYGIETFLISPQTGPKENEPIPVDRATRLSLIAEDLLKRTHSKKREMNSQLGFQKRQDGRRPSGNPNLERRISGNPGLDRRISGNPGLDRRMSGNPTLERRISFNPNVERRPSFNPTLAKIIGSNAEERRPSGHTFLQRMTSGDYTRRTAFMDNNINRYHKRLENTDNTLEQAIESMPLSKYDQWMKESNINPLFLIFKNIKREISYIYLPDPLFKYYLVAEILVLICIMLLQNITAQHWEWTTILEISTIGMVIIILLPLTWTYYIWNSHFKNNPRKKVFDLEETDANMEDDTISYYDRVSHTSHDQVQPDTPLIKFCYNTSEAVTKNIYLRTMIYVGVCAVFTTCIFNEMINCEYTRKDKKNEEKVYYSMRILQALYIGKTNDDDSLTCTVPWHLTQTCSMGIIMSFLFLRIHAWLKFLFGATIAATYSYCLWTYGAEFYENSETFNYAMKPAIAHILSIVYLTFTLHLIDRQSDYMNRLDHNWNQQLIEEEEEASITRENNFYLLQNILPIHVAEVYLDVTRSNNELYYEEYANVAVMFATIICDDLDDSSLPAQKFLSIMDQIISDFDELVLSNKYKHRIEKIKVANWSYMAACGLIPGKENKYRKSFLDTEKDSSSEEGYLTSLLNFAIDIRNVVNRISEETCRSYKMRIGICYGEVTAGVVGSKKPLYDIWGDTVNMASRMDSRGLTDRIQVTKRTATVLMNQKIQCDFRGLIYVKGKSKQKDVADVPTYFVSISENNELIHIPNV